MPKLTIVLDATQIKQFDTCEHSWALGYKEHLRKTGYWKKAAEKGSIVHFLLETYYRLRTLDPHTDKMTHAMAALDLMKAAKLCEASFGEVEGKELKTFLYKRFVQYISYYYGNDFIPLKRNGVPAVEVGFSVPFYECDEYLAVLEGKIDVLTNLYEGKPEWNCFVDHKTRGQAKNLYGFKTQFLTYATATGFHYGMYSYFGMAQTFNDKKPDDTFNRRLIYIPDWKIKQYRVHLEKLFDRIYQQLKRLNLVNTLSEWHGTRKLNVSDLFGQNLSSCAGPFENTPCQFAMLCENPIEQREAIKATYYEVVKPWTPWSNEE